MRTQLFQIKFNRGFDGEEPSENFAMPDESLNVISCDIEEAIAQVKSQEIGDETDLEADGDSDAKTIRCTSVRIVGVSHIASVDVGGGS